MEFNIKKVREYLSTNGTVYTVRSYDTKGKKAIFKNKEFIKVKEIKEKEELKEYVNFSGFTSVDKWWEEIKKFIWKENQRKWLYKVIKLS